MKENIFAFLRNVPLFAELSESDLTQICQHAHEVSLSAGEILFEEGEIGTQAYIIIEGQIEIYKISQDKKVQLATRQPGEMIGEISLLEATPRVASGVAQTDCVLIAIGQDQIDRLMRTNPEATRTMLHTVIVRLQSTEISLRQSEKMAQLGTFTAGIAHEINNPSAAVLRGAEQLKLAFERHQDFVIDLQSNGLTGRLLTDFQNLHHDIQKRIARPLDISAADRLDWEAELENWLDDKGVEDGWELAPALVNLGYQQASLDKAVSPFPAAILQVLLRWIVSEIETQRLMEEIHQGAARISDIVKALKSYVYLDQAPKQNIDIHQGLENTLIILRHRLKQGIEVIREYDNSIPLIPAYGSELNQVWTNLIDNSIDAVEENGGKGRITLRTAMSDSWIEVGIEDNGPGIPPEVQAKLFYPFYTTKPVGKGTGLGLNISYRIVQKHGGAIKVISEPGLTRFEIRLPMNESNSIDGHPA